MQSTPWDGRRLSEISIITADAGREGGGGWANREPRLLDLTVQITHLGVGQCSFQQGWGRIGESPFLISSPTWTVLKVWPHSEWPSLQEWWKNSKWVADTKTPLMWWSDGGRLYKVITCTPRCLGRTVFLEMLTMGRVPFFFPHSPAPCWGTRVWEWHPHPNPWDKKLRFILHASFFSTPHQTYYFHHWVWVICSLARKIGKGP